MDNLTTGLLFNDTMVMIAGGDNRKQYPAASSSSSSPPFEYDIISPSSSSSSSSSTSSSSPSYYSNNIIQQELFTEFEFNGFELGGGGGNGGNDHNLLSNSSSDEERNYMEELISSDLSSDEDKFLETIRYGGGVVPPGVEFGNEHLLSEEELVNTIQNYGDVKVVQVEDIDDVVVGKVVFDVDVGGGGGQEDSSSCSGIGAEQVCKVEIGVKPISKKRKNPVSAGPAGGNKKRVGGGGGKKKQQPPMMMSDDDEIIIEASSPEIVIGSPSPGSPLQQKNADGQFQELKLSDEEKRLLLKEGITLPTHYPLTKLEERELKRIRRKIRNKISAQDSRKRKKEFLDRLQQRVQEVEEEKSQLHKRVRSLECINNKLNAQVKRLQQALASATSSSSLLHHHHQQHQHQKNPVVPAATTLLVLILSLALVVLPTQMDKNGGGGGTDPTNELISLLNRSNEQSTPNSNRVLSSGDGKSGAASFRPKSRAMVSGELDEDGGTEEEEHHHHRVAELVGEMKNVLMRFSGAGGTGKRKRINDHTTGGLTGIWGRGGGGNVKRARWGERMMMNEDDWWVSDNEEEGQHAFQSTNVIHDNMGVD